VPTDTPLVFKVGAGKVPVRSPPAVPVGARPSLSLASLPCVTVLPLVPNVTPTVPLVTASPVPKRMEIVGVVVGLLTLIGAVPEMLVTVPERGVSHDSVPVLSVDRTCPAVPRVDGRVQVTLAVIESGALNAAK
jgi:hypothetical protein